MDNPLQVSSTTILKDRNNIVVWLGFNEDTRGFSDRDKSRYLRLINQEIQAIVKSQVPSADDNFLLESPVGSSSVRVFVEEDNDLSRIAWLTWQ